MGKSYRITASGRISVLARGFVVGATLNAAAPAAASLVLDDSTGGSGVNFLTLQAAAGATTSFSEPGGRMFKTGCYATLTGAGAVADVTVE